MELNDFIAYVKTGALLESEEIHEFMHQMSEEARRITFQLNSSYHTQEEIRQLLSQLFGYEVPASLNVFPPLYSDFGKNIHVGENVFTQVAGVHADGDNKANLYSNALMPERFGRKREYALGKTSGKANIDRNLQELGLELTPEQTMKVTQRITELGDRKKFVTQEDLPYIVSDVLKHSVPEEKVKLISYMVSSAYGLRGRSAPAAASVAGS